MKEAVNSCFAQMYIYCTAISELASPDARKIALRFLFADLAGCTSVSPCYGGPFLVRSELKTFLANHANCLMEKSVEIVVASCHAPTSTAYDIQWLSQSLRESQILLDRIDDEWVDAFRNL
ncbi:hypothetical protein niasHS_006362 [Heterodera schachtii]|uniref:Uncharacterized protein n=1 Tax=Heterodera schachtii TaxID=97005 RepID=A0ABD2JWJ5_HETSC